MDNKEFYSEEQETSGLARALALGYYPQVLVTEEQEKPGKKRNGWRSWRLSLYGFIILELLSEPWMA